MTLFSVSRMTLEYLPYYNVFLAGDSWTVGGVSDGNSLTHEAFRRGLMCGSDWCLWRNLILREPTDAGGRHLIHMALGVPIT